MDLKAASNLVILGIVAAGVTAGVGYMRLREASADRALTVSAIEQGVNHALAASAQPPDPSVDPSAQYQAASVSPALDAQVRADDVIQLAIDADVQTLNDLICQHANHIFAQLQTEAIAQGKDVEAMALGLLRQHNLKTQQQAEVGGYNGTAESTGVGVSHMAKGIAFKFVLQDISDSKASGSQFTQIRFCVAPLWEGITANSTAITEAARSRAASRSEAIKLLQRSEVASDGL